jgi:TRAP-type C4-dicarboxylate transport system permease small subunit
VSAAIVVAMFLLICLEITMRTLFQTSTHVADELVAYGVGIASFFALGESLETCALIRVGLVIERLNATWRRIFEIFSVVCISLLWMIPVYMFSLSVQRAYVRGYSSDSGFDTPLWIPQLIFLIGLTIFLLHLLSYLLRLLAGESPLDAKEADLSE